MANTKLSALPASNTNPALTDTVVMVKNPGSSPQDVQVPAEYLACLYNPYKFSVYRNAAWSSSSTPAAILFDTVVFDTSSNYSAATGKFTAPAAGFYQFNASAGCGQTTGNAAGSFVFYKNGSAIAGANGQLGVAASWGIQSTGSCLLELAASDYVQVYFSSQNSISGNTGQTITYFMGFLVSLT